MTSKDCPRCDRALATALAEAVAVDDIDRAMSLGLLDFAAPLDPCRDCAAWIDAIVVARDARLRALASRKRYRSRQSRLIERAEIRARRRAAAAASAANEAAPVAAARPALPPAAAAALARAKAKAAAKGIV